MRPILISSDHDLYRLYESLGDALWTIDDLALYVSSGNVYIPEHNGIGVLADADSCIATHELNGQDEIVMTYPMTGWLFDKLELRSIIVARVDRTRGNQPYRIYRITKPISGKVKVYARHIAYDLSGVVVSPYSAEGIQAALAGLKNNALTKNYFSFESLKMDAYEFNVPVPTDVWTLLGVQEGSILDIYGGEYSFNGFTITLYETLGQDNHVFVRYGVNMTDLEQDSNCADCYTGVVTYWKKDDVVEYSNVINAPGSYDYDRIMTVDMSSSFDERPTKGELDELADAYISANEIGIPKISWQISFVPLDSTEEYKNIAALETVSMGDTVGVYFEKLGVNATARVVAIEWNVLLDRYVTVTLGSVKSNVARTIVEQDEKISKLPSIEATSAVVKELIEGPSTANIVAGKILSKNNTFFIDLDQGVLLAISGYKFYAKDYSPSDVERVTQIIDGNIEPTEDDLNRFDFYKNGNINSDELIILNRIIDTGKDFTISWYVKIDPTNQMAPFSVGYEQNGAVTTDGTTLTSGIGGVKTKNLRSTNIVANNKISANIITADTISGDTIKVDTIESDTIAATTSINCDDVINCKRLFVNGHEIT